MYRLFSAARLALLCIALGLGSAALAQGGDADALATRELAAAVEARDAGRTEEAVGVLSGLLDSLERAGRPVSPVLLSDVLFHYAEALRLAGDFETAETMVRRALDIDVQRLPPDSADLAAVRSVLGAALLGQGRAAEAEGELRATLQIYEGAYGDHRYTASTLVYLAEATLAQGRFREAAGHAGASRLMMWRLMFTDRPASLDARAQGFADRAHRAWFDEARAARDQSGMRDAMLSRAALAGGGQPGLKRSGELWEVLRELMIVISQERDAEQYFDVNFLAALAMEIWPMADYRDPDLLREAMSELAHDLDERGQAELALDLRRRNVGFAVDNLSHRPPSIAIALQEYALALMGEGRSEEAADALLRHYDFLQDQLGGTDRAHLMIVMASSLCLTGQRDRAWQLAEAAGAGLHDDVASVPDRELFLMRRAPVAVCVGRYEEGYADFLRARELSASRVGTRGESYYATALGIIALTHLGRPAEALEHLRVASAAQMQRLQGRQAASAGLTDESLTTTERDHFILRTEAAWGAAHAVQP